MYSSDFLQWVVNIVDYKLTGEHNGAAQQQANPKAKPKKMSIIESFRFLPGVAPIRWQRVFDDIRNREVLQIVKDQPKKKFSLELLIDRHKKFNNKKTE